MKRVHRRRRGDQQRRRRLVLEHLEPRCLLSANNLSAVPFWDGETTGPPDCQMNRFGGNPGAGSHVTVSCEATEVHSGNGSVRIEIVTPIPAGTTDYVSAALTGFGPSAAYVDARDITNYEEVRFWLKNQTGNAFELSFEVKDADEHLAHYSLPVLADALWREYTVPLHLGAGWTDNGNPDLSRTRMFALVMKAPSASALAGKLFLDDMTLTESGGILNPQSADFAQVVGRMAERQFRGLWGSRDHTNGLVPLNSAFADVMALNSTAGLVQLLPAAMQLGWVTQAQADAYVADLVDTLHTVWNNVQATGNGGYLPPRYIDRVALVPAYDHDQPGDSPEESPADAAFLFLALYQYRSLDTTAPALAATITGLLDRFDFAAFSSANGWKLAYQYVPAAFTPGAYDGYSTEIYVISLAAHLATNHHVDIAAQWNSGTNRVLASLVDPAASHLVHTDDQYRAPFGQWLFSLFADVSQRGDDTYPDPDLRRNPYWNAVLYQREAFAKLAELGRPTFAQPDAADDGTGTAMSYEQYSLYNDFGQPDLFMPWSATFGLQMTGDLDATETALRALLARDLHGPLGISDAVVWPTGAAAPTRLPARQDFWNLALSTIAMLDYLTGQNADFAQLPAVAAALDEVLPVHAPAAELPVPQTLLPVRSWITFTPTHYNPDWGLFPTEAELRADLQYLYDQGWRGLVTYTIDNTLNAVPRIAKEVGFTQVIAGLYWWDDDQLVREKAALPLVQPYADAYVLGNEGLYAASQGWRNPYTRAELEAEIAWLKQETGKPVTTTETGGQYLDDPTLMDVGDWVFPNIQPYGIDSLTPAQAVESAKNEFLAIQSIARTRIPGRVTVLKEIWWPTSSHTDATPANQAEFFRLLTETPILFVWGESFDQTWKNESAVRGGNPGPYWGLNEEDRTWKNVISERHTDYTERYADTTDYGDAPDPAYPTLARHGGAGHVIVPGYYLGARVDPEPDGQPTAAADGDAGDEPQPDEDGVEFLTPLVPGREATLRVTASAAGTLNAWLDVNHDGDWDDDGEHFAADAALQAGQNTLTVSLPPTAVPTDETVARFRFSSVGGLSYTGLAPDGEVEDYAVAIEASDIRVPAVATDGETTLLVAYQIVGDVMLPFVIGFFVSADPALDAGDTQVALAPVTDPADLTAGMHYKMFSIGTGPGQITLPGAGVAETDDEYFVLAAADPQDLVGESDADPRNEDNTVALSGVYHPAGGAVFVHATQGADLIAISPGSLQLVVNGRPQTYDLATITGLRVRGHGGDDQASFDPGSGFAQAQSLLIHGGAGNNALTLHGSTGDDVLTLYPARAEMTGPGYTLSSAAMGQIYAYATAGGNDEARLYDSPGDDTFSAAGTANGVRLQGPGYDNYAEGFDRTYAYATGGGMDTAKLYDSTGDDTFSAAGTANGVRLQGPGVDFYAEKFEKTYAYATAGGVDMAKLYDSAGDDTFTANGTSNGIRLQGPGIDFYAEKFEKTYGYANTFRGGTDTARLYDSAGDDTFLANGTSNGIRLQGPGIDLYAEQFEKTYGYAPGGGVDTAKLYDSAGDDTFLANGTSNGIRLQGPGIDLYAEKFEKTYGYATEGGTDTAKLYDSAGDDTLSTDGSANGVRLQGPGIDLYAEKFEKTYGYATAGGTDTASMTDSAGDDTFTFDHPGGRFQGLGFDTYAESFERYYAYATYGGYDRSFLYDTAGDDALLGRSNWYQLTTPSATARGEQFAYVKATKHEAGTDTLDVDAVDYLFEHVGDWL